MMLSHIVKKTVKKTWSMLTLLLFIGAVIKLFPYYENICQTHQVSTGETKLSFQELVTVSRSSKISSDPFLTIQNHDHGENQIKERHYNALISHINLKNISKLANKIFDVFSDDQLPDSNWSSYKQNITTRSNLNFPYLITGEEICKKDIPYLLIIIPSVINEIDRRDLMRKTWLRAAKTNSWPREEVKDKVKHIFVFGLHKNDREKDLDLLMKESLLNNDIVVADFEDSYRNLSIKMLVSLKWTLKYCDQVQFFLKVDMDTFINVPLMMRLLHHVQNNVTSDKLIIGLKHGYDKPIVVRNDNRWKVSQSEYPLHYYPKYVYGHTYALSIGSISLLVSAAEKKPIIAPEDAFITGILPKLSGVLRLNAPSFTVCCKKIFDCEVVWNTNVAITEIKNNALLEILWTNIIFRQCDNTHPI